jgi:ubiquinone biosynthesis accessory factor UbiJ
MEERLLPHVERAIAQLLRFDPETLNTLAALNGRVIQFEIDGMHSPLYLFPDDRGLGIRREHDGDVHVRIRSTIGGLVKLGGARMRDEPVPAGAMEINGDLGVAQQVQQIIARLDIDWEEMASRAVGDTAARKLGLLLRDTRAWLRGARQSMTANFSEYVRYETETVPERDQVEAFMHQVDMLRADADRLSERVRRLQRQLGMEPPR